MLAAEYGNILKAVDEKNEEMANTATELAEVRSLHADQAFIIQRYQEDITSLNLRAHQLQNLATEYAMKFLTHQSKIEGQIEQARSALESRAPPKRPDGIEIRDEQHSFKELRETSDHSVGAVTF